MIYRARPERVEVLASYMGAGPTLGVWSLPNSPCKRPNEMQISCRPSRPGPHKPTLPLSASPSGGARGGLRPTSACRLHLRVRPPQPESREDAQWENPAHNRRRNGSHGATTSCPRVSGRQASIPAPTKAMPGINAHAAQTRNHATSPCRAGRAYRDAILAPAGTEEPDTLVRRFLGRPERYESFYRELGLSAPGRARSEVRAQ
jgi:hypothetical protein